MGHESQIEPWTPLERRSALLVSELTGFLAKRAMKTANRGNPNLWTQVSSNRAYGAAGQNISLLISGGCEARKIPAVGGVFFLTSSFIELRFPASRYSVEAHRTVARHGVAVYNGGTRHSFLWRVWRLLMRRLRLPFVVSIVLFCALHGALGQNAPDNGTVTVIAPGGIQAAVRDLAQAFQSKTGIKVEISGGTVGVTKQKVASGGAYDVSLLEPPYDDVIASGNVVASSATPVAETPLCVVVKQGAARPDISTDAAIKKALLEAKSVAFPDSSTGAGAGVATDEMLDKLGIKDEVKAKAKYAVAMNIVAAGGAEMGISFLSQEMMPGLDNLGPVPTDLVAPSVYYGFLSSHPSDANRAKQFLAFLTSPDAAPAYKAHGLLASAK